MSCTCSVQFSNYRPNWYLFKSKCTAMNTSKLLSIANQTLRDVLVWHEHCSWSVACDRENRFSSWTHFSDSVFCRVVLPWSVDWSTCFVDEMQLISMYHQMTQASFHPSVLNHVVATVRWVLPVSSSERPKWMLTTDIVHTGTPSKTLLRPLACSSSWLWVVDDVFSVFGFLF